MIRGVTHAPDGTALQRLSVATKVSIGYVQNGVPKKSDHFLLWKKGTSFDWIQDEPKQKFYHDLCEGKPTRIPVVLRSDNLDEVFRTEYAWWARTEKRCWGNGDTATRRTERRPEGESWPPQDHPSIPVCGPGCEELEEGMCKPSGDLYFMLAHFPQLGAVCRLHTSSYRSVRQLYSGLREIQTFTGGRLAGVQLELVVRPERCSYVDERDQNKKKTTTVYVLSLEQSAQGFQGLLDKMMEFSRLAMESRKHLLPSRTEVVEDDETVRAQELQPEFHPDNETSGPAETLPSDIQPPDDDMPRRTGGGAQPLVMPSSAPAPAPAGTGQGGGPARAIIPPLAAPANHAPASAPDPRKRPITEHQRWNLADFAKEKGWTPEQLRKLWPVFGENIRTTHDITEDIFKKVMETLEKGPK
jgi:hypothetical protein